MAGRLVSCPWISIFMNSWLWKADFLFNTRLSLTEVNYNQQTMIDKFRTLTFSMNQTKKPCFTKDTQSHWTTLIASLRPHYCQTDTCFHKQELKHRMLKMTSDPSHPGIIFEPLTLYTLTSVCLFSILFYTHLSRCSQGEYI